MRFPSLSLSLPSASLHVLSSPSSFSSVLQSSLQSSRSRILLSALYLGTDSLSWSLVHSLGKARDRGCRVSVVLDGPRTTRTRRTAETAEGVRERGGKVTLVEGRWRYGVGKWGEMVEEGIRKTEWESLTRWREVMGTWHVKVYVFDNDVIVSGANLSETYFTNRTDRYVWFRNCPELADFYDDFLSVLN